MSACEVRREAGSQLVCGDPQLGDLEHRLQVAYQQAQARPGADQAALTSAQPPVISYQCPADFGPPTAQFYNEFAPPTAVLTWKGTQEILFIQPSGSGARYGRQGSEYWEHQGEVKLEFNGTRFVCHTQ